MSIGRSAALLCLAVACAVGAAFALAPKRTIVTHAQIAAPPDRVGAALTDASRYDAWTPDIRLLGRLSPGQVIEVQEGQGPDMMVFHPVVLVARPGEEVRWAGRIWLPRVFDAVHYFRLEADGVGTRLTQGEEVRGVAAGRGSVVMGARDGALRLQIPIRHRQET